MLKIEQRKCDGGIQTVNFLADECFTVPIGKDVSVFTSRSDAELFVKAKAERDQTPLTVEVLERMISDNEQSAKEWLIDWHHSVVILNHKLTVGELRTLARLAGVELKESKSGPWKDASEVPLELVAALKGGG